MREPRVTYVPTPTTLTDLLAPGEHRMFVATGTGYSVHLDRSQGIEVYVTGPAGFAAEFGTMVGDVINQAAVWEFATKLLAEIFAAQSPAEAPVVEEISTEVVENRFAAIMAELTGDDDDLVVRTADRSVIEYRESRTTAPAPAPVRVVRVFGDSPADIRTWAARKTATTAPVAPAAPAASAVAVLERPAVALTPVGIPTQRAWASRGKRTKMSPAQQHALQVAVTNGGVVNRGVEASISTLRALIKNGWAEPVEGYRWGREGHTLVAARITKHGLVALTEQAAQRGTTPTQRAARSLAVAA